MSIEKKLESLGMVLPPLPAPAGNYVPVVRSGHLLFCSGMLCFRDGKLAYTGKLGREQSVESGQEAARCCVLNALANIKAVLGSLERVKQVVSVSGFVNGVDGFAQSPAVLNGASDLLVALFGDRGRHARTAVSVNGLPLDATVEIQMIVEVE